MPRFSAKESAAAARAAHAYLSGESTPRTTRANPSPQPYSIANTAVLHHAKPALTKKYVFLLKKGLPLPSDTHRGTSAALTGLEERALVTFIKTVEGCAFAATAEAIRNYASFLRQQRFNEPMPRVSETWVRRFKKRHKELLHSSPNIREITRGGAEMDVQHIAHWFEELDAVMRRFGIKPYNLWNFDETPLQIGWVNGSLKLFSTRKKRNRRPTVFQPGNKESLTSVDAVSAAGRAIPSFLILTAKVLLEEYVHADIDDRVVLTFTDTGFNNSHRAVQWLQHFNRHSFAASESFGDASIEEWFGYPSTITKKEYDEKYAFKARTQVRPAPPTYRLLLMDSFAAHENPEFIWYCQQFDIVPFRLPSHMSHRLQPLDVGVYQYLKAEQRCAIRDFLIGGGTQMSRFDFLNQWNRMYAAAFKACHIYAGFEKAGIFPLNPDAVLEPLRRFEEGREKPQFPYRLRQQLVSPRKVKRHFATIQKDIELLRSPVRKTIKQAEACIDLAIITQESQKNTVALQKEHVRLEARRTRSRRQIRGIHDGAYTVAELRKKEEARAEEDQQQDQRRRQRQQKAFLRQLRDENKPRLRGGAAVKAKRERLAAEAAAMASQESDRLRLQSDMEKELLETRRRAWIDASKEERDFLYRIRGPHSLEAIPEAAEYLADVAEAAASRADIPEDILSVSSGPLTPLLPGNETSDDDEIEIITSTQIDSLTNSSLAARRGDSSYENSEEEEGPSHREDWGGFGYNRMPNNYSDDEEILPEIVVAGIAIPVPPSRAGTRGHFRLHTTMWE